MAPEQDWCLECGTAVTTRVVPPPSFGLPIAVGLGALALLAAVVVVALNLLSDDANQAASNRAKPAAAAAPARTQAPPARQTTQPRATTPAALPATTTPATTTETVPGAAEARGGGPVPVWPANKDAYTLVADSTSDRAAAEKRARELTASGLDAGILRSDGYDFFSPGAWIVWTGQYPDRPAAEKAAPKVQRKAPSAYVTLIRKRGGR
jgi:hypothetical protein